MSAAEIEAGIRRRWDGSRPPVSDTPSDRAFGLALIDIWWLLSQLSALSEALTAAQREIKRLKAPEGADMQCSICHEVVEATQTAAHLAAVHPTPPEGFLFFYEARPYRLNRPSLPVAELLAAVGGSTIYKFYEERDGSMFPLSHGQAVDLTNGPRKFFSIPPATI